MEWWNLEWNLPKREKNIKLKAAFTFTFDVFARNYYLTRLDYHP